MNIASIDRGIPGASATPAAAPGSVVQARPPDVALAGVAVQAIAQAPVAAIAQAAERMEEHARSVGRTLQFRIDDSSGRVVVSVRDPDTGELIRQIPSESALKLARDLGGVDSAGTSLIIDGLA